MPGGGWPRLGVAATLALALALFGGIYALRANDPSASGGEGLLFALPIGVLALRLGLRGGLAGAVVAFVLLAGWDVERNHERLTALGFANRGVAFLALGALLGAFVDRRRRLEAEVQHYYDASLDAQRKAQHQLANSARSLERKVVERTCELDDARAETLQLLAVAAEYRDDDTFQHAERVGVLSARIGLRLGLRSEQIRRLREAAPLHDVGKIAIPDRILLKPGRLTPEEHRVMEEHAALGARLLARSSSPVLQMAAVIAATHHEWWNGTGYPSGLAGERIPIVGRIVAVADVFDALTHARPYKPAWPVKQARARIERASGSQFDPRVVAAFLAVHAQVADSQDGVRNGGPPQPAGQPAPAELAWAGQPLTQPLNEWNSPSAPGSVGVNGVNA
ncbi:MAG TPA: HD-GYP domain-containing protein [Solirubrobacteraceae bacterium]|jgi:HD-GYP domain-containing protein (c-di-GMP phosphodiesterase class II)|nr:HD-GYP domain-containing protein [Solirubrobacteraceae bacterium]